MKKAYLALLERLRQRKRLGRLLNGKLARRLTDWEVFSYLLFGVLTTAVNFLVFWLLTLAAGEGYASRVLFRAGGFAFLTVYAMNAAAWVCAVLFAFFTNRALVFESRSRGGAALREFGSFAAARVLSLLLFDELLFGLLCRLLPEGTAGVWIAKLLCMAAVIVFNYAASKLVIFRRGGENERR